MKKRKALYLLAALAAATTYAQAPWASVNELVLGHKLNDEWSLFSRSRIQFTEDFNTFSLWFADAGLAYKLHQHIKIGAAYRYLEYRVKNQWESENRPMIELTFFGKPNNISLANRSRFEFRFYDFDRAYDFRYRNRTRADFPWGIAGIKPYLEDELFWGRNQGKFNQNWLTGGIYFKPADLTKIRAAYRWAAVRSSGTNKWRSGNQLYLALIQNF
jgi:hypothetical protein